LTARAQFGNFREGAPLYGPRPQLGQPPPANSGLPKPLQAATIEQHLDAQMPLDAQFKDETGRAVQLKEYFGKRPVILALVYYDCPMLCNQVLNGMTGALKQDNFNAGNEFEVVVVSFDPRETPELAAKKKASYLDRYGRPNTANGWHFLTGDQANIDKVTQTAGFNYYWDNETNQFAHASAIIVLTAEGHLSRYIYGIEYAKDLHLALVDAGGGKIGSKAEQLLLYCYHYDPARGKYGFAILNVMRAGGVLTVAGIVALIFGLRRRKKPEEA
jgi:protein SCO1/2